MRDLTLKEMFDIESNFIKQSSQIYECFVKFYGEEHREYIMNKFNNTNFYFTNFNINSKLENYKYLELILSELLNRESLLEFNKLLYDRGYKSWTIDYIEKELLKLEELICEEQTNIYKITDKCLNIFYRDNDKSLVQKILEIFLTNEEFMNLLELEKEESNNIIKNYNFYMSEDEMESIGINYYDGVKNNIFIGSTTGMSLTEALIHELNHNFINQIDNNLFVTEMECEVINEALTYNILELLEENNINLLPLELYAESSVYENHTDLFELVVNELKNELFLDFKDIISKNNSTDYLYRTFDKMGFENYQKLSTLLLKDIILVKELYKENISDLEIDIINVKRKQLRLELEIINNCIKNNLNIKRY